MSARYRLSALAQLLRRYVRPLIIAETRNVAIRLGVALGPTMLHVLQVVMFASNPRGGSTGTIAYLSKAVVRLVQNSVENEGVCYVS